MTEAPSRNEVIELLQRLGSDRDEDVLEAAREVHARIAAANTTWEELLVPEEVDSGDDEDDDEDNEDEDNEDDEDDAESPDPEDETARPPGPGGATGAPGAAGATGAVGKKDADSMVLIAELLAKSDISADMREELEGYKADIAEGEFEARDRRYLSAVHKRLSKRR